MGGHIRQLRRLARLYGVQTSYYDVFRRRVSAAPESLVRALQAAGAPVEKLADVPPALRARSQELWRRLCEPVAVAWDGGPATLALRVPAGVPERGRVTTTVEYETGETRDWVSELQQLPVSDTAEVEGVRYTVRQLRLPDTLPIGYHRVQVEVPGQAGASLVLSAPRQAFSLREKVWGVFLPLYALHSRTSWGAGDFSDLAALADWASRLGGKVIATLPILAAFLDEPFDPSPYAPVSRLFWNEFYIDVAHVPELQHCTAARALLASTEFQQELESFRAQPFVDYRRQMAAKQRVLSALARTFFQRPSAQHGAFRRFLESHTAVEDYARFRAAGAALQLPWPQWPQPLRDGVLDDSPGDEDVRRYHLYVQWVAHEQLETVAAQARLRGPGLYLDLPLGVHMHGYDVWRERRVFAVGAAGGAPPDAFFTKGQNWGFPPLHPERLREDGYRYLSACVRHHMRQAGMLRIDHVMGLHRLFWIPDGLEPREGVYVGYPAEEMYALLSLESHRHQTMIVGENLGTVPSYVNAALAAHNIQRMYVVQYEFPSLLRRPPRTVPAPVVASVNTHDMPPFAAFWQGVDIRERFALGLLDEAGLRREQQQHETLKRVFVSFLRRKGWLAEGSEGDAFAVYRACLAFLAASAGRVVLVNLEDVWGEALPQNVPGTGTERRNWQRKTRDPFEVWSRLPEVVSVLGEVSRLRARGRKRYGTKKEKQPGGTHAA
ncbi:MAG: 4-alpha-glucanotransferase [Thermodesulfobacteriota bacterium]|jgi:4-alpha-glucanotransferase